MGIAMYTARLIRPRPVERDVDDLTDADRKNIQCQHCPALVTLVCTHAEETETGREYIARFLRLRGGHTHTPGCRNEVDGAVAHLVATSRCADGTAHLLERDPDGIVFRLHVLDEAERVAYDRAQGRIAHDPDARLTGRRYVTSARRLHDYLRTAAGVANLYAVIEGSTARLRSLVRIVADGQSIRWPDFFYGRDRYAALAAAALASPNQGRMPHLVAIVVIAGTPKPGDPLSFPCREFLPLGQRTAAPRWIAYINATPETAACIQEDHAYVLVVRPTVRLATTRPPKPTPPPGQAPPPTPPAPRVGFISLPLLHPNQACRLEHYVAQ